MNSINQGTYIKDKLCPCDQFEQKAKRVKVVVQIAESAAEFVPVDLSEPK